MEQVSRALELFVALEALENKEADASAISQHNDTVALKGLALQLAQVLPLAHLEGAAEHIRVVKSRGGTGGKGEGSG